LFPYTTLVRSAAGAATGRLSDVEAKQAQLFKIYRFGKVLIKACIQGFLTVVCLTVAGKGNKQRVVHLGEGSKLTCESVTGDVRQADVEGNNIGQEVCCVLYGICTLIGRLYIVTHERQELSKGVSGIDVVVHYQHTLGLDG